MKTTVGNETSAIRKALLFARSTKARIVAARAASRQGLETRSFDQWHPDLNAALSFLPESSICPHELYRLLVQNPGPARKRIILVTERGTPVALVGLRERWGCWEPVTQWLVPGMVFPVADGYIGRVLGAIGLPLNVAWWRCESPPPALPCVREVKAMPTFGISCSDDFEGYWRKTSHLRNLKGIRNRCEGFEIKINEPGIREWTIMNWGGKWGKCDLGGMPDISDRMIVAEFLDAKKLLYTLSLHDHGRPVAGATLLNHCNDAVAYVNYRCPEYDFYGAMNRLIDFSFYWARDMSFNKMDMGGSADYKKRWAPENGIKYEFRVLLN